MKRLLKWTVRGLLGALAIALASAFLAHLALRPNPSRANEEQYAVYSAYLEPRFTGYSHDLGDRNGPVVILADTTVQLGASKLGQARFASLSLARGESGRRITAAKYEFVVLNLFSERFDRRFAITPKYVLESDANAVYTRYPRSYGYITLSRIGFNSNLTEAYFYTEHQCGLCGEGQFVQMRKVNGKWTVIDTASTWIS